MINVKNNQRKERAGGTVFYVPYEAPRGMVKTWL
jgi:hypothetical protein